MIEPGGTIGILGGGQLGRMLAMAAAQLGYRCLVYAPDKVSIAADVSADLFANDWHDAEAMAAFARKCDVITWEFENVPVAPLQAFAERLAPHPRALEIAQDRLSEKRFVEDLGGRPAPYAAVDAQSDLTAAAQRIGLPGILKTRRDGYDGKGQWRLQSMRETEDFDRIGSPLIFEGLVDFTAEFSVVLVRGEDGETRFWDSSENVHEGGILATSTLPPCDAITAQVDEARKLSRQVADALGYVGVLTLEFFATAQGPVFNEMAPRVHNSGHWTIEGAATSQFENHIRAICGLPLGSTATVGQSVRMQNLIGEAVNGAHQCLSDPDAHLHLYGKSAVREGRKMGHVTYVDHGTGKA